MQYHKNKKGSRKWVKGSSCVYLKLTSVWWKISTRKTELLSVQTFPLSYF